MLYPSVEAEDELRHRMWTNDLTPDRYKHLLLATGVAQSEAETARAKLELALMQNRI